MRSSGQFVREHFDERIHTLIDFPEVLDFRYRVQNRRVVPAIVEFSDLRKAPISWMAGHLKKELPVAALV